MHSEKKVGALRTDRTEKVGALLDIQPPGQPLKGKNLKIYENKNETKEKK